MNSVKSVEIELDYGFKSTFSRKSDFEMFISNPRFDDMIFSNSPIKYRVDCFNLSSVVCFDKFSDLLEFVRNCYWEDSND